MFLSRGYVRVNHVPVASKAFNFHQNHQYIQKWKAIYLFCSFQISFPDLTGKWLFRIVHFVFRRKNTKKLSQPMKPRKTVKPQIYHNSGNTTWMTHTDVVIYQHITAFKTTVHKKIIYKKIKYDMLVAYLKTFSQAVK